MGLSCRDCAKRLGRHHTTVSRELTRNPSRDTELGLFYEPLAAQEKSESRKIKAWNAKHLLKSPKIFRYVTERLLWGWSPEQISGRLEEVDHPNDSSWSICFETIYQFVYHPSQKDKRWWEYLRRKQKRRRTKTGRKSHRCLIPDRVSIHKRPEEVGERKVFGYWEGDSIIGKNRNHGLHTTYERVASFIRMEKMPDLTADSSITAQIKIYSGLPSLARKSITLDNGHEHVLHGKIKEELGISTYFADPYSSWQRGGNENANMWIRYYFPKGTDFRTMPEEDIKDVEWELNNRPRKRLKYLTPQEVFKIYLGGAIVS
jgi:IS30 family transposase